MAAYRPDVTRISWYEWDVSKHPGETTIFKVLKHGWCKHSPTSGWVIYQRWRPVTSSGYGITYISACIYMIATKFLRLYLCFRCQATRLDWSKYWRLSGWVRNQRWQPVTGPVTGSGYEITYISDCMRDNNEIPTAIPMFSISSNTTDFGILKKKCSRVEFASKSDQRPLIQRSRSLSYFHQNYPQHLHLRWRSHNMQLSYANAGNVRYAQKSIRLRITATGDVIR